MTVPGRKQEKAPVHAPRLSKSWTTNKSLTGLNGIIVLQLCDINKSASRSTSAETMGPSFQQKRRDFRGLPDFQIPE